MSFLEQLAKAILAEEGTALGEVAVVLPSQRAALYLRGALAREAGKALWSPEFFTLDSFMERLGGLRVMPMDELLFEAFEVYRELMGAEARGFDDLLQWAPTMLADMSEADAHLVPLAGFYRDLRSWEELDWSFNVDPLSEGQQRMVRYWAMAGQLHPALNERLRAMSAATAGASQRAAAVTVAFPWKRIWFAGLNAFTKAEQVVIDRAHADGVARFAWDADRYFLDDPKQEAGLYLRQAMARYGSGAVPAGDAVRSGLRLQVVRAPGAAAQAWCAVDRIRALAPAERERAAIVLADEGILPALLEALDEDIGDVNITMGLPLTSLPVGPLITTFYDLAGARGSRWVTDDVVRLLTHPWLRSASLLHTMDMILDAIRRSGSPFVDAATLKKILAAASDVATTEPLARVLGLDQDAGVHARLVALLAFAQRNMRGNAFATQQLYEASLAVHRLQALMERYGHAGDPSAQRAVITRILRAARVGFFGEPLSGLQVMGLLESRALDHHHLIVLGAEEGKLPTAGSDRSFIPFDLRRAHGLPLRESTDAVQSYNFMRMLQRAHDVVLVHTESEMGGGPSRYIGQLEHELLGAAAERLVRADVRLPVPVPGKPMVCVPNSEVSREAIARLLGKGLTPTMLGSWLRCPLDFWLRFVMGLKETDEPGARLAASALGNALHGAMQEIYTPWLGSELDVDAIRIARDGFGETLKVHLLKRVQADVLEQGQPLLQMSMARRAGVNFLSSELRSVQRGARIIPLRLEHAVRLPIPGALAATGCDAHIAGRLDRVDERDGLIHVLDLKTGRVKDEQLRAKDVSLSALRGDRGYAAQLMVYVWAWMTSAPDTGVLRAGLLPMQRATGSEGIFLQIAGEEMITRAMLPPITTMLVEVVRTLLDPTTRFEHDPKSPNCVFCARDPRG